MQVEGSLRTARRVIFNHMHEAGTVRRDFRSWEVDLSGRCESPALLEYTGRPDPALEPHEKPLFLDAAVRCRRCAWCLRQRARDWADRASCEATSAVRSWFITLTLRPQDHYLMVCRAGSDTFAARHRQIGREITLYLKRIRKESGARFRYIVVAEKHKSGLPHYHLLLHEQPGCGQLRWKTLSSQWKLGFSKVKLVEHVKRGVTYVTKYLAKSAEARVRASQRYGSDRTDSRPHDIESEASEAQSVATEFQHSSFVRLDPSPTYPPLSPQWGMVSWRGAAGSGEVRSQSGRSWVIP